MNFHSDFVPSHRHWLTHVRRTRGVSCEAGVGAGVRSFWYTYIQMMQKIDRKEFVQGVAVLGMATAAGISFGKEERTMKKAELKTLANENAFDLIGKEWMLVTAGNKEKFNTMTASWGGIGWLWNKPVAFIFIRPER